MEDSQIISCIHNYRHEAKEAKRDRMEANKRNFDAYHMRQDFSYKTEGQSRDFLPKVSLAVEQNANMIQQGLMDCGDWFKVEPQAGVSEDIMSIKPSTIYKILDRQLSKDGFMRKINDMMKLGQLGALIIVKVGGKYKNKPKYEVKTEKVGKEFKKSLYKKDDKAWQLDLRIVRHEDYFPDPTGRGLYEMEDIYMDYHDVLRLATGSDAIYDMSVVKDLAGSLLSGGDEASQAMNKSRETGQNIAQANYRKQVKLTEVWGNIINEEGELVHENIVCTIANDQFIIQKPTPNPYWHQESPFIVTPLLSVPHAVWGKALMDAPTSLNTAVNELYNLMFDGAMMAVHGIKQIREDWVVDASQVADGIQTGTTVKINSTAPIGGKVIERVDTAGVPAEAMSMLQTVNQEFYAATLSNEMRGGGMDFKNVRATAVVESSQAINNMFTGIAKQVEGDEQSGLITPLLQKAWKVISQHILELDKKELAALVGQQVVNSLEQMGAEEIFADTVQSTAFRTFGISATLNKQKDFTKMTALLQTIASSEPMMEAFIKKYDFTKFLTELMRSLDIPAFKIEADEKAGGDLSQQGSQMPGMQQGEMPNQQSQIAQAGAVANQGDLNPYSQMQPNFPPSRAT